MRWARASEANYRVEADSYGWLIQESGRREPLFQKVLEKNMFRIFCFCSVTGTMRVDLDHRVAKTPTPKERIKAANLVGKGKRNLRHQDARHPPEARHSLEARHPPEARHPSEARHSLCTVCAYRATNFPTAPPTKPQIYMQATRRS